MTAPARVNKGLRAPRSESRSGFILPACGGIQEAVGPIEIDGAGFTAGGWSQGPPP